MCTPNYACLQPKVLPQLVACSLRHDKQYDDLKPKPVKMRDVQALAFDLTVLLAFFLMS